MQGRAVASVWSSSGKGGTSSDCGRRRFQRLSTLALLLSMLMVLSLLTACGERASTESALEYGSQAADWARELASLYPYRPAYSEGEQQTANWIVAKLDELGYSEVERQPVQSDKGQGENLLLRLKGSGFHRESEAAVDVAGEPDPSLQVGDFRRRLVLLAAYDSLLPESERNLAPDADGISDNASGVAALLQLLQKLKGQHYGYDLDIVFVAARGDDFRGSRSYLASLSEEEKAEVEAVFVLENLYGGDKLYANAGPRSVLREEKVRLRQPLMDLLDISVSYYTGLRLLDNQSSLPVKVRVDAQEVEAIYREFTLKRSDFSVFDEAGLPGAYIEATEYQMESLVERDSQNPVFEQTNGRIRGTNYDSQAVLQENMAQDLLETRINAITFILKTYVLGGIYNASILP